MPRKSQLQTEIECCENWIANYAPRRAVREATIHLLSRKEDAEIRKEDSMWRHLQNLRGLQAKHDRP